MAFENFADSLSDVPTFSAKLNPSAASRFPNVWKYGNEFPWPIGANNVPKSNNFQYKKSGFVIEVKTIVSGKSKFEAQFFSRGETARASYLNLIEVLKRLGKPYQNYNADEKKQFETALFDYEKKLKSWRELQSAQLVQRGQMQQSLASTFSEMWIQNKQFHSMATDFNVLYYDFRGLPRPPMSTFDKIMTKVGQGLAVGIISAMTIGVGAALTGGAAASISPKDLLPSGIPTSLDEAQKLAGEKIQHEIDVLPQNIIKQTDNAIQKTIAANNQTASSAGYTSEKNIINESGKNTDEIKANKAGFDGLAIPLGLLVLFSSIKR